VSSVDREILDAIAAKLRALPPQALMEECCKAAIYVGDYAELGDPAAGAAAMLDGMNYTARLQHDPLPMRWLLSALEIVPGYGTVPGDIELGGAVRQLEIEKASRYCARHGIDFGSALHASMMQAPVVVTSGATGAVNLLLRSIARQERSKPGGGRTKIVYNAPSYPIAHGLAAALGLVPVPVVGLEADGFLAQPRAFMEACDADTLAVFLVLPTNPAHTAWGIQHLAAAKALLHHCQSLQVPVIIDTIFEDLNWDQEQLNLFAAADCAEQLIKVFSPSKDRVNASGYRIGYAFGAQTYQAELETEKLLCSNSSPTIAQAWFAIDLIFRHSLLVGELQQDSLECLRNSFVFGYGASEINISELKDLICDAGLFPYYRSAINRFKLDLRSDLNIVYDWLATSECFEVGPRPLFGNTIVVVVRDEYYESDYASFVVDCLTEAGALGCVGECFEYPSDGRIRFRVVLAGKDAPATIEGLRAVSTFLKSNRETMANPYG
jgi:DNA-binding transcriptional MocR family regulator